MSWGMVAVGGASLVGGLMSSRSQASAADRASGANLAATTAGIAEQRRQYDIGRQIMNPYVQAGYEALGYRGPEVDLRQGQDLNAYRSAFAGVPSTSSGGTILSDDAMMGAIDPFGLIGADPASARLVDGAKARDEGPLTSIDPTGGLGNKVLDPVGNAINRWFKPSADGSTFQPQYGTGLTAAEQLAGVAPKTGTIAGGQYEYASQVGVTPDGAPLLDPNHPSFHSEHMDVIREYGQVNLSGGPQDGLVPRTTSDQQPIDTSTVSGRMLSYIKPNDYTQEEYNRIVQDRMAREFENNPEGMQAYLESLQREWQRQGMDPADQPRYLRQAVAAVSGGEDPKNLRELGQFGLMQNLGLSQAAASGLGQMGAMEGYAQAGRQELENQRALAAQARQAGAGLGTVEGAGLGEIGRMQDTASFGQGGLGGLGEYQTAGQAQLQGIDQYGATGNAALFQQQALSGLAGPEAQRMAIAEIEQSPEFEALVSQGEQAILQNASATGGLRGGATQGALANFRKQALNELVNQKKSEMGALSQQGLGSRQFLSQQGLGAAGQRAGFGQQASGQLFGAGTGALGQRYGTGVNLTSALAGQGLNTSQYLTGFGGNLSQFLSGQGAGAVGDIARMGQASAAGTAAAAQQSGTNISNLLASQGAANANAALAQGQAQAGMWNNLGSTAGLLGGMHMMRSE